MPSTWSRSMSTAAGWTRSAATLTGRSSRPAGPIPGLRPVLPHLNGEELGCLLLPRLEGDVAVLARRPFHGLAQAQLQSAHKLASGLTRLDDVVDVAPLRRDVRVGETRRVLGN